MLMIRNAPGRKKTVILYISITIALTWLLQFMPIMLGLDVSDTSVYVISRGKVFPIFFLHMFKNIILTGAMIYPFSFTYKIVVVPVEIIIDLIFYFAISHTSFYKKALKEIPAVNYLKIGVPSRQGK